MSPMYKFLTQDDMSVDELLAKQVIRKSSKYVQLMVGCMGDHQLNHGFVVLQNRRARKFKRTFMKVIAGAMKELERLPKKHSYKDTTSQR